MIDALKASIAASLWMKEEDMILQRQTQSYEYEIFCLD